MNTFWEQWKHYFAEINNPKYWLWISASSISLFVTYLMIADSAEEDKKNVRTKSPKKNGQYSPRIRPSYMYYKTLLNDQPKPFAFVDLNLLDENINTIIQSAKSYKKTIRIATKSIRCVPLIKYILSKHEIFQGVMCFSAREAIHLSQEGIDNILIGYPCVDENDIENVCKEILNGKKIIFVVDSNDHVHKIEKIAYKLDVTVSVCMEINVSNKIFWEDFGVWRSPIDSVKKALLLMENIQRCKRVKLIGIMGYEAQIAGVTDANPFISFFGNLFIRAIKAYSSRKVFQKRKEIIHSIKKRGIQLEFVNGGGTGSLFTTREDPNVTEITVGSAFFAPLLFDYYKDFRFQPAMAYAIEITRIPKPGVYTCHGGGFIASGAIGQEKLPQPYLPKGATLRKHEGVGEVQTPIVYNGKQTLLIGDPIFMRHAKAGELCEHFNSIILIKDKKIVEEVKTYRGDGHNFI